jgi:hypothetical protein
MPAASSLNSFCSAGLKMSRLENNPWETAFREDLDLPAGVSGPVEAIAFLRLASICASVAVAGE